MKKYGALLYSFVSLIAGVLFAGSMLFVQPAFAQTGSDMPNPTGSKDLNINFKLENPLKGVTDVNSFFQKLLDAVVLLLSPVVVLMLLWSGLMFITARGNTEKLDKAKKALMWTLVGAAIILGAKGLSLAIGHTVQDLAK